MTREEAIKCIQEEKLRYERAPLVNGCPMWEEWQKAIDICDMAISALRAQQEQESKPTNGWISVHDRLPEPWEQVLIYSRHDFCESAFYIGVPGKWRSTWNHEMLDADSVTHWMPMPELPEM